MYRVPQAGPRQPAVVGPVVQRGVRPNTVQIEVFRRQFVSVETTTGADDGENTQGTAGEG